MYVTMSVFFGLNTYILTLLQTQNENTSSYQFIWVHFTDVDNPRDTPDHHTHGVCGVCGVWCEYRKEKIYHMHTHTNPIAIESFNISRLIYLITPLPTLVSQL